VPQAGEPKYWTVKQGKNTMMATGIPAAPRMVSAPDPFGGLLFGYSAEYRIVSSPDGRDTTAIFGRAWTAEPVSSAWRHATVERMIAQQGKNWPEGSLREAFREDQIPGTFPAFAGIAVDGAGNRWVQLTSGADTNVTRLDVFDPAGRYLGPVRIGRNLPIYGAVTWTADDVYAVLESDEGSPAVMRYHIERKVTR
jgi:hypothetical protein